MNKKEEIAQFLRIHVWSSEVVRTESGDPVAAVYYPEDWELAAAEKERAEMMKDGIIKGRSKFLLIMDHSHTEGRDQSVDYFDNEEDLISALIRAAPVSFQIWKGDKLRLALVKEK